MAQGNNVMAYSQLRVVSTERLQIFVKQSVSREPTHIFTSLTSSNTVYRKFYKLYTSSNNVYRVCKLSWQQWPISFAAPLG